MKNQTTFALAILLLSASLLACSFNSDTQETAPKSEPTKSNKRSAEKVESANKPSGKTKTGGQKDDLREKVCKKYDECGCQDYGECMEQLKDYNDDHNEKAWSCLLKSSCESLCAGKPDGDGCIKAGNNPGTTAPQTPDCYATTCTSSSQCPSGCHGGCSNGHCYLF